MFGRTLDLKCDWLVAVDGTEPDIDYLWTNHQLDVLCRRARGYVCAKYSFTYNNEGEMVKDSCLEV